jgi:gas vesicle protein
VANDNGNVLLALVTGAAIGVGIGMLYAPEKGIETRHKIKDKALNAKHDLTDRVSHAKEELTKTANEKKVAFEQKLEEVISKLMTSLLL